MKRELEMAAWPQYDRNRVITFESEELRKDGTTFLAEINASLIWSEEGKPIGMTGVTRDITERRRAEEALRASEAMQSLLLANLPAGVVVVDPVTRVIERVNERVATLFGAPVDHLVGRCCHSFLCPAPEGACPVCDLGQEVDNSDLEMLRKDGSRLPILKTIKRIQTNGHQKLLECFIDISDRKRAEVALRESEFRYRLMAENTADVIWVLDAETKRFSYISPSVKKLCGYTPEEVMARPMQATLTPESAKKAEELLSFWVPKFQAEPSTPLSVTAEMDQPCKDGSIVHTEVTATGVQNRHGKIEIVGVSRDITERKHAEQEKDRLERQLQQAQKMESVGRLAGGVAHDFNNMLGVILGNAEIALDQVDEAHMLHENLTEILKAGRRSADLTRQLLAFARKQTVAPKVLDLNETIAGMLKMLERMIGENILLNWQPAANLWPVRMDPSQIDQILANLCVNSRDAISDSGSITIETGNCTLDQDYCAAHQGSVDGEYVRLLVGDDGCGMDKQTLSHIFEPFFTTKQVGLGTGLGLATVYGAVKQNNGYINVDSKPGAGTAITIYLPRHRDKSERPHLEGAAPAGRGRGTILLVEDEPAILKMTMEILQKQGHTVLAAATSTEAVRLAREHPGEIHLLITDVVMPDMNGRSLAQKLVSLYPRLKCLFMSGYTADVIAHQGMLEPGTQFIQKPFSIRELAEMVHTTLDLRQGT